MTLRPDPAEPERISIVKLRDGESFRVQGTHVEVAAKLRAPYPAFLKPGSETGVLSGTGAAGAAGDDPRSVDAAAGEFSGRA